ncbi:peptidoglycan DD-metalloendopeptidase family protein, partial [Peptoniphilaceae bacterium SGI.097]
LIAESSSFQFEGNTYVTNEDGYTYQNVFYDVEGKKYYAGPDGARVTGYTMIDGAMWRFDSNGALVQESSAYEVNGKKYFSKPDGSPYRNQVLTFGDKAYYMGADGSRQYGLIRSGDVTYYAHTGTGELLLNAGLFTVADSTFYSGSRYALSTGLLTFGDVAYYFDPQAEYPEAVKSTTRTINGITYQFDSTGRGMRARMRWPLPGHTRISSYCGLRWGSMHAGIDIPAPIGTPILACSDGTVVYSGYDSSRGNHVIVQNDKGNCSIYMHMCRKAVSQGERVHVGQVLGYVGMTGNSTGPHLHFELRIGGARGRIVNPLIYEYDQK